MLFLKAKPHEAMVLEVWRSLEAVPVKVVLLGIRVLKDGTSEWEAYVDRVLEGDASGYRELKGRGLRRLYASKVESQNIMPRKTKVSEDHASECGPL